MFIGQHLCAHSQCGCMRESRTQEAPVSMRTALAPSASLPVSQPCTLARLTPRNAAESLYNDVPWPKRAAEEHDAFAAVLERRGIAVDYLGPLLEAQGRGKVVRRATDLGRCPDEEGCGTTPSAVVLSADKPQGRYDLGTRRTPKLQVLAVGGFCQGWATLP